MLKKTMLTLTVLGSLVIALPSQARDRDDGRYEVQQTRSYAYNQHNSHRPRVVFYFNSHQPQYYGYRNHYRQDRHHYRQQYRQYDRHHGGHHERRYDRH